MGATWEELGKGDHMVMLEVGSKVMNEDNSVNLYEFTQRQTQQRFQGVEHGSKNSITL